MDHKLIAGFCLSVCSTGIELQSRVDRQVPLEAFIPYIIYVCESVGTHMSQSLYGGQRMH